MKLKDLLNRISQGLIITLVILFFLNLSTKLPFAPRKAEIIRSYPEAHFLKELLIIAIISLSITFVFSKIKKEYLIKLTNPFKRVKENYFLAIIFILSLLFNCLVAYFVFEGLPSNIDDLSYINQAKIFSTGRLYASAPVSPEHFCSSNDIVKDGKWYSRLPPGFPLILALGILIKLPLWVVNPILGSLSLVLIYFVGKELYDKRIAIYASILGLFSAFFLLHNGLLMSETITLFFILLFILFFTKVIKEDSNRYPILSGLCLGMIFITRPYSALFFSLPFIIYLFYLFLKRDKNIFKKACLFSAGFMIFLLLFLWYNWELTGNFFTLAYNVSNRVSLWKYDYPGFHRIPYYAGLTYGLDNNMYTSIVAALNVNKNFLILNRKLFGWPVSLIFIFVPFLFMRKNKWDILLMSYFFSIVLGYSFYWNPELRYWHAALPALLFLTARGITKAPLLLQKVTIPEKIGQRFIVIFVIVCFLYSFLFWYPFIWKRNRNFICYGRRRIFSVVKDSNIHNAIIFISCNPPPNLPPNRYYPPGFLLIGITGLSQNSLSLQDDILYALDLGQRNIPLMKHYSGRRYFIYEYNFDNGLDNLYEVYRE